MLANVLAIVAGVPLGVLLISLIVRGEEIVGMLLHVLQYLFEAITYILAALAFAATTLQLFLVRDRSKRAKQLRQRYQHEAQVRQLEATLKTWQPFTIDKNAAMRNAMLSEMHQNARTLVVPQHWDTTDIKPPRFIRPKARKASTPYAAEPEKVPAIAGSTIRSGHNERTVLVPCAGLGGCDTGRNSGVAAPGALALVEPTPYTYAVRWPRRASQAARRRHLDPNQTRVPARCAASLQRRGATVMEKRTIITVHRDDILVEIVETKAATASSWGTQVARIVVNNAGDRGGEIVLLPSQINDLIRLLNALNDLYRR